MSDSNPVIVRLEALLVEINEAEEHAREAAREAHSALKALHIARKAHLEEMEKIRSRVREDVRITVQTALDRHMRGVQETLDLAARRSISVVEKGLDAVLRIKRNEIEQMRDGHLLGAMPIATDHSLPGLKRKPKAGGR